MAVSACRTFFSSSSRSGPGCISCTLLTDGTGEGGHLKGFRPRRSLPQIINPLRLETVELQGCSLSDLPHRSPREQFGSKRELLPIFSEAIPSLSVSPVRCILCVQL